MPNDRDPNAIRLPDDVAQRLLARATELDERHGRTSIDQLRRAAVEAGISPVAFEGALAELARGELGGAAPGRDAADRRVTDARRRRLVLIAAVAVILAAAAVYFVGRVRTAPPSPVRDVQQIDVRLAPSADVPPAVAPVPAPR